MNNKPKRRKAKDNPYNIKYIENTNVYVVEFKFNNTKKIVEVSKDVYEAFNQFELDDLKQLNEYDRHIEHLEQTDEFLYKRSVIKDKGIEDDFYDKKLKENLILAINNLSNIQKRRIIKYYFEGKSEYEIAKEENATQQSIHIGIQRAINNLKKYLKKLKF